MERADDAPGGSISEVAIAGHPDSSVLVSAVRDADEELRVNTWSIDDDSMISPVIAAQGGDGDAGAISSNVSATRLSPGRAVTAVRGASHRLKIIVWEFSGQTGGNLKRLGDAGAGKVGRIAIESLSNNRCVTAVQDDGGSLKVIVWDIDGSGNVERKGDASAGVPTHVVAIRSLSSNRVVTALRDGDGKLKLIVWDVSGDGQLTRRGEASAGAIGAIAIGRESFESYLATFVRDSSFNLKGILWNVDAAGQISRSADHATHSVAVNGIVTDGGFNTVVRDGSDNLRICRWSRQDFTGFGGEIQLSHNDVGSAGAISELAAASVKPVLKATEKIVRLATAVRTQSGNLKIIVWKESQDIPQ